MVFVLVVVVEKIGRDLCDEIGEEGYTRTSGETRFAREEQHIFRAYHLCILR
jgi:hypothetical protein